MIKNCDQILEDLSLQAKPYLFYEKVDFPTGSIIRTVSKYIDQGYNFLLRKIVVRYPERYFDTSLKLFWCNPVISLNKVSDNRTFQDADYYPVLISSMLSDKTFYKDKGYKCSACVNGITLNDPFVFYDALQLNIQINPQLYDFHIDIVCSGFMTPEKTINDWGKNERG